MNTIKYRHSKTGEVKLVKVAQKKNAIWFAPRGARNWTKAFADKIMFSKGYVR